MMVAFSLAIGCFLLACIADVWTTLVGVQHGLAERNPLVRWATRRPWLLYAVKASFALVAVLQFVAMLDRFPIFSFVLVLASAWLTAFVALRNVKLIAAVRDE